MLGASTQVASILAQLLGAGKLLVLKALASIGG